MLHTAEHQWGIFAGLEEAVNLIEIEPPQG